MEQSDKENQQNQVETQLEENMVFEFFNTLLRELCIRQPDSPVDWLIQRLHQKAPMRVVVLGPPGGSKKEVCDLLAKEMELKHLSSGQRIWSEIENKTDLGKQLETSGFNDVELVDDHTVTRIVTEMIKEYDELIALDAPKTAVKGWVVDGFPRTQNQAQQMQVSGQLPDKVFILHEDEALCKQKLARRFVSTQQVPEEEAFLRADVKYRNQQLYLGKIRAAFKDILIEVDTVKLQPTDTFACVKRILEIQPKERIAYRSPSIVLVGPPGSGKEKIAKYQNQNYGLNIITKQAVLWRESKRDTALSALAKTALDKGEQLDDEVMAKLIIQRLSEPDCEFNGWVLLDFPDTVKQVALLAQSIKLPKVFVQREFDTEQVFNNLNDQRLDTNTGEVVSLESVVASDADQFLDLPMHPQQTRKSVEMRLDRWERNKDQVQEQMKNNEAIRIIRVQPSDNAHEIQDKIDEVISLIYHNKDE